MKVRKEFDYDIRKSFRNANPFTIAFCYPYPLYDTNFIVKGGLNDVEKFIKKQNTPIIVHYSMWRHGRSRNIIRFENFNKKYAFHFIRKEYPKGKMQLIKIEGNLRRSNREVLATFKRIPRKWLRELNPYVLER